VRQILFGSFLLIASACAYDTSFNDCAISCTETGCPDGLECRAEGLCRVPGETDTCSQVLGTTLSCVGLAKSCGPNGDEDCCSTADPIPGGTFYRSYDVASDGMYPNISYPATVSPFVLDRFEVTVGRFRKFVEAGNGTRTRPPQSGAGGRRLNGADNQGGWDESWNTKIATNTATLSDALKCGTSFQSWTDAPGENEDKPINCVTWYEALAFCAWDGGFIPTEAEWNYVAAGGNEQRAYPWSNPASATAIDCSYANYKNDVPAGAYCVNGTIGGTDVAGLKSPKGDGRWGQTDLAGNVWEWVLDWYLSPYENPCDNCAELTAATDRIFRGGGFGTGPNLQRTSHRGMHPPDYRWASLGIRCARAQ